MFKSGRQNDMLYATVWQALLAGHAWKGKIIDQHKNGSQYMVDQVITLLFVAHQAQAFDKNG